MVVNYYSLIRVQQEILDSLKSSSRSCDFYQDNVTLVEVRGLFNSSRQFQNLLKKKKRKKERK